MSLLAAGLKRIRYGVVIFWHVLLASHGAEMGDHETMPGLCLDDLALVLVCRSLVLALPHNRAAWLPVGLHLGPKKYCLICAGSVRADHTRAGTALMSVSAIATKPVIVFLPDMLLGRFYHPGDYGRRARSRLAGEQRRVLLARS